MQIEWTNEDVDKAWDAWRKQSDPRVPEKVLSDAMRRVMAEAVALFLARASGQVKEDRIAVSQALTRLETMTAKYETEATNALSRLSALAHEAKSLRAKVADLVSESCVDEVLSEEFSWRLVEAGLHRVVLAEDERDTLRAEVERLKAVKETTDEVEAIARRERDRAEERARFAESRLAAIRERAKDGTRMRREYLAAYDKDPNWQPYQAAVAACLQVALWVLDGDAPNSSMLSKGSGEATNAALLDPMGDGPICVCAKGWKPCVAPRHPCSSTCTHDDAANPGHPELVKAQSVAVAREALGMPDKDEPARQSSEAFNQAVEMPEADRYAYEACAEAMRSVVEKWARESLGEVPPTLKAVLDGAA